MWWVLQKKSPKSVREEMNARRTRMSATTTQPAELWRESGRRDTYTKAEGHYVWYPIDRQERGPGANLRGDYNSCP